MSSSARMMIAARKRQAEKSTANPSPEKILRLDNPNTVGLNVRLEKYVLEQQQKDKENTGTGEAFNPKIIEWEQCCEYVCPSSKTKCHLTCDKVYKFMFYQSFREKKKAGTNKDRKQQIFFEKDKYEEVMKCFKSSSEEINESDSPQPKSPIGIDLFDQYKAVFRLLFKTEVAERTTSLSWEHIWQMGFDTMKAHVKVRHAARKRENCEEKHKGEFSPYLIAEKYGDIEERMWLDSQCASGKRNVITQLRHCYCFKHLTTGLLRCESLYSAELSDFIGLRIPKKKTDCHQPFVMINQITHGKTNHGRILYGRATRHRDVKLCCICALGIYLTCRFDFTREFLDFKPEDWMDNNKWFFIKLLVDGSGRDKKKQMQNDSCGKHIKKTLNGLGLPNNKMLHLGRNVGSKKLDLEEVPPDEIKRMGNWNPSVFDDSYSSKIPMIPVRRLAGFDSKFCCLPRDSCEPSDSLLESTPIGKWCYTACDDLKAADEKNEHSTALQFLRFMKSLNGVVVQDLAAMAVPHEKRAKHPIYEIKCFKSKEFEDFKDKMRDALKKQEDPINASIEAVLPGVYEWNSAIQGGVESVKRAQDRLPERVEGAVERAVENSFSKIAREMQERSNAANRRVANCFYKMAKELLHHDGAAIDFESTTALPTIQEMDGLLTGTDESYEMQGEQEGAPSELLQELAPPVAVPDQGTTTTATTARNNQPAPTGGYELVPKHPTLSSLWDEWFGLNGFADRHGGIDGREKKCKKSWRKNFSKKDKQLFSRTSRTVQAIQNYAKSKKTTDAQACQQLEEHYAKKGFSVANFVPYAQAQGWLETKGMRGKQKKKPTATATATTATTTATTTTTDAVVLVDV